MTIRSTALLFSIPLIVVGCIGSSTTNLTTPVSTDNSAVSYHSVEVAGVEVFYREAGPSDAPTLLLLHGFPSSSHTFRDLMVDLGDRFHLIAPDYPGFGYSAAPPLSEFGYTFDNLASIVDGLIDELSIDQFSLYMHDYGAPIGFRVAARRPGHIRSLIVQNGVAHLDGVTEALAPLQAYWQDREAGETNARGFLMAETTQFQYMHGAGDLQRVNPDSWTHDQERLDRPGNDLIQLELLYDYQNNVGMFETWQKYFQDEQPDMLIIWGENDPFFSVAGAKAYQRDLPAAQLVLLNGGHFAQEEYHRAIAEAVVKFSDELDSR